MINRARAISAHVGEFNSHFGLPERGTAINAAKRGARDAYT